ncbi:MAG TPA: cysteine rich repeat-containing protein [Nitrospiria bacterium]|nr:cysteine rich repeat-containing protein [Nitrospiria bacterium]
MVPLIFRKGFKFLSASVWLLVLVVFPLATFANEGRGENDACKADFEKYCKDVKPGEGRIMQCMKEHEKDFSQACKTHMAEKKEMMEKKIKEAREACKGDVEKYCKDVKPGGGRIMQCLAEHKDQLSDTCKENLRSKPSGDHKGMGDQKGMKDKEDAE